MGRLHMPTVTLNNGRSFEADPAVSILDAARNAGTVLEYSCRLGRCSACKAPITSGRTKVLTVEESLSDEDRANGIILTCCRAAEEDVSLDIEPLDRLAGFEIKTMPARISTIERLSPEIMRVVLRTPPTTPMRFLPGQYVDVIVGGARRSYSLANAPREDNQLELLIKHYPGGELSAYFFERAVVNDLVRIEGPLGTFFLREEKVAHIVLLATGTGIAPVKALLEELDADTGRAGQHGVRVYWGNRHPEAFVWNPDEIRFDFAFHRLLSGTDAAWTGRRGRVHEALLEDGIDPDDTAVYACGADAMIASARASLTAQGLPPRRFYSDAFVLSS